jgi:hypothetical protein
MTELHEDGLASFARGLERERSGKRCLANAAFARDEFESRHVRVLLHRACSRVAPRAR